MNEQEFIRMNVKALIMPTLEPIFEKIKQMLAQDAVGKGFSLDKAGFQLISLREEVRANLTYQEAEIYANDKTYYILIDDAVVYKGFIDQEGIEMTIENDILYTHNFMNPIMMIANDDVDALIDFFSVEGNLESFMKDMQIGFQKGQANGHY